MLAEDEKGSLTLAFFAAVECGTGLGLLLVPDMVIGLLFAQSQPAPETPLLARVAGAALLAISAACWGARRLHRSPAALGLLVGLVIYNAAAAAILAYAVLGMNLRGPLIWPAALYHAALLPWCLVSAVRMLRQQW